MSEHYTKELKTSARFRSYDLSAVLTAFLAVAAVLLLYVVIPTIRNL